MLFLMLEQQPAVLSADVGVQKSPRRDGLTDSSGITTERHLDQKQVLERFVSFCGKPANTFICTVWNSQSQGHVGLTICTLSTSWWMFSGSCHFKMMRKMYVVIVSCMFYDQRTIHKKIILMVQGKYVVNMLPLFANGMNYQSQYF